MKHLRASTSPDFNGIELSEIAANSSRWYFDPTHLKLDNLSVRVAFDSAPVAIVLCNLAGDLLYANPSFKKLLNIDSLETLTGKSLTEICQPLFGTDLIKRVVDTSETQFQVLTLADPRSRHLNRVICQSQRVDGAEHTPRWLVFALTA